MRLLDAEATSRALPWGGLLRALEETLSDHRAGRVQVPLRAAGELTLVKRFSYP